MILTPYANDLISYTTIKSYHRSVPDLIIANTLCRKTNCHGEIVTCVLFFLFILIFKCIKLAIHRHMSFISKKSDNPQSNSTHKGLLYSDSWSLLLSE